MQMHRLKRSFLETGHKHAVVAALYNRNFHQCISVDEGNLACVWDMRVRPASQPLRRQSVPCRARDAVAVGTSVPRARCRILRSRACACTDLLAACARAWGARAGEAVPPARADDEGLFCAVVDGRAALPLQSAARLEAHGVLLRLGGPPARVG
jgi:hypothetical protein